MTSVMARSFIHKMLPATLVLFSTLVATAADWPQWMGPNRDDDWTETGIIESFSDGGPNYLWRKAVSGGFSGPAVVAGRVYVTDYLKSSGDDRPVPTRRNELQGKERVLCLDAKTATKSGSTSTTVTTQSVIPPAHGVPRQSKTVECLPLEQWAICCALMPTVAT